MTLIIFEPRINRIFWIPASAGMTNTLLPTVIPAQAGISLIRLIRC
ncbi:MAG: hypothetical protein QME64_11180 [bacterium]|nr:hypothetical protein [bacterium]